MKDAFPIPEKPTEIRTVKVDKLKAKEAKKQLAYHIESIKIALKYLSESLPFLALNKKQKAELERLIVFNRKFLREENFEGANPSSIAKAMKVCYRGGWNVVIPQMRRPTALTGDVGYSALYQALRHAEIMRPPPPPAHVDYSRKIYDPERRDYDGLSVWSKTKPSYEPSEGEVLSQTPESIAARERRKHRVEADDQRYRALGD